MSKLDQLLISFASTTPGAWEEDNDGFIVAGDKFVSDSRCDIEPYADANTEFIVLMHNSLTDILYAIQILHKMVQEDQKGADAFDSYGPEARSALRKLGVHV